MNCYRVIFLQKFKKRGFILTFKLTGSRQTKGFCRSFLFQEVYIIDSPGYCMYFLTCLYTEIWETAFKREFTIEIPMNFYLALFVISNPFIIAEVNESAVTKRWHLSGLAFMQFSLNNLKRSCIELSNFSKNKFKFMSEVYRVLLSA